MRKATANNINKVAHQIPIVWTEGCQEETQDLKKQQNTQRIMPGGSKPSYLQIKKEGLTRGFIYGYA